MKKKSDDKSKKKKPYQGKREKGRALHNGIPRYKPPAIIPKDVVVKPKGEESELYQIGLKHIGRPPKYTPKTLLECFVAYADWVKDNPLMEAKLEKGFIVEVPKARVMSETAFMVYAGISLRTWHYYKGVYKHDTTDYSPFYEVSGFIAQCIYNNKFEGATSGFFNANIIARDLGLVDKKEVKSPFLDGNEEITFE